MRDEPARRVFALVHGLPEDALAWTEEKSNTASGVRPGNGASAISLSEFAERTQKRGASTGSRYDG